MTQDEGGLDISQVAPQDAMVAFTDLLASIGKAGVLRRPSVFPFYYQISIADGISDTLRFQEMQNTEMVEFQLESDGLITIKSNLFRLLGGSANLTLTGKFGLQVPEGRVFPIDFVPRIKYDNQSGSTRLLSFYGWLAPLGRHFRKVTQ